MSPPTKQPRSPGFDAGAIRVEWADGESWSVSGRPGLVYPARIARISGCRMLKGDLIRAALQGLVVEHDPEGLARIAGVEAHCTYQLSEGEVLGLLLVPVER